MAWNNIPKMVAMPRATVLCAASMVAPLGGLPGAHCGGCSRRPATGHEVTVRRAVMSQPGLGGDVTVGRPGSLLGSVQRRRRHGQRGSAASPAPEVTEGEGSAESRQ